MPLTPKESGGGSGLFPHLITQSALLEEGCASSGNVAETVTIALGFKPTAATIPPLNDMTGHYLLTIQKQGMTVRVWKQGTPLVDYTGSIGASYAEFLSNVLTAYSGSAEGKYSRLVIVEQLLTYNDFWTLTDKVTGLWIPKEIVVPTKTISKLIPHTEGASDVDPKLNARGYKDTIFDGNTSQSYAVTAVASGTTTVYASKAWAENKVVNKLKVYAASDYGIAYSATTLYLEGQKVDNSWETIESAEVGTPSAGGATIEVTSTKTTAYKAHRARIVQVSAGDLHISEIQFFEPEDITYGPGGCLLDFADAANLGADSAQEKTAPCYTDDLCNGGTAIASTAQSGYPASEAFDNIIGDTGMYPNCWWANGATNQWIGYDFGAGNAKDITRVQHQPYLYSPKRTKNYRIEYSDDGLTWQTAYTGLKADNDSTWEDSTFDSVGAHQYWRLYIVDTWDGSLILVQEVEMMEADGFTSPNDWTVTGTQSDDTPTDNLTTRAWPEPTIKKSSSVVDLLMREGEGEQRFISGTATSSGNYGGTLPAGGFTTDVNYVVNAWVSSTLLTGWLQYELPVAQVLTGYGIANSTSTNVLNSPKDFTFEGSNNGTDWTVLDTQVGITWGAMGERKDFAIASPGSYKYYRLNITDTQGNYRPGIGCLYGLRSSAVTGLEFQPDLVKIKAYNSAQSWNDYDSGRGVFKSLSTDTTGVEVSAGNTLTAFNADGYSLGDSAVVNGTGINFLDLCLKAGPEQGFEIVKYTGDGVAGRTVAHNLGKAPTFMIVKRLDAVGNWYTYHKALGAEHTTFLDLTDTSYNNPTYWNDKEPTSTQLTLGNAAGVNASGGEYLAYLFTDSDIFKAFSYIGNGLNAGPKVELGGKILHIPFWKNTAAATSWPVFNPLMNPVNEGKRILYADTNAAEEASNKIAMISSTGLTLTGSGQFVNGAGHLHVGLAILESTKYSNAF